MLTTRNLSYSLNPEEGNFKSIRIEPVESQSGDHYVNIYIAGARNIVNKKHKMEREEVLIHLCSVASWDEFMSVPVEAACSGDERAGTAAAYHIYWEFLSKHKSVQEKIAEHFPEYFKYIKDSFATEVRDD